MLVDLNQRILDLNALPIPSNPDGTEPWVLGKVCSGALSTPVDTDKDTTPDKAVDRWMLAVKLHAGGSVDLTPEQISDLRKRIVKVYTPMIAGQACSMLDPKKEVSGA